VSDGKHRDPTFPAMFAMLYQMLARAARASGYALALHGSMGRDLDVIACPWTDEAVPAEELVETLRTSVDGFIVKNHRSETNPTKKPHGRLGWSIHLTGSGTYIDLSVMPRAARKRLPKATARSTPAPTDEGEA